MSRRETAVKDRLPHVIVRDRCTINRVGCVLVSTITLPLDRAHGEGCIQEPEAVDRDTIEIYDVTVDERYVLFVSLGNLITEVLTRRTKVRIVNLTQRVLNVIVLSTFSTTQVDKVFRLKHISPT